jgi:hypothetical protein
MTNLEDINPYASGSAPLDEHCRRRPWSTVALAVLLFVFGGSLAAGAVIRLGPAVAAGPLPESILFLLRHALLPLIAMAALVAAGGLISGRRLGWWLALAACYFGFATFVVLRIARHGIEERPTNVAIYAAIFVFYWACLHRRPVLAYFGHSERPSWRAEVATLLVAVLVVFGLGLWV